ncbi:MAG: ABC transporter ATP-binding protein, partial [Kiloniellales bacterium]|nr:ABC transporter ATP-binding protein [Kiloniellales bacterium]
MTNTGLPLKLSAVSKRYEQVTALRPTDLTVDAGEFVTLLGPSGSGKTTLLSLVAGYAEPTSGQVRLGERDITRLPARHRNIGMVFQSYALFPHMTVGQNVAYGLKVRGRPKREIERRVDEALAIVQLSRLAERSVRKLSGGQQQRVALARA